VVLVAGVSCEVNLSQELLLVVLEFSDHNELMSSRKSKSTSGDENEHVPENLQMEKVGEIFWAWHFYDHY